MRIAAGCRVELDYELATPEGELLEASDDEGPLEFVAGAGELPDSIESALSGKTSGEEVVVSLGPDELFGPYDPAGIVQVDRQEFPDEEALAEGAFVTLTVEGDDEESSGELEARILEVRPELVVLDTNPPLAGRPLVLRARVRSVAAPE